MRRLLVLVVLSGCRQLLGFEDPIVATHDGATASDATGLDAVAEDAVALDATQFACPADPDLRACFAFEGNGLDGSPVANHAVIANGAYLGGHRGLGLVGSPTTTATAPYAPALNLTRITLRAWIYPTALPVSERYGILDANRYSMFVYPGASLRCQYSGNLGNHDVISPMGVIPINTWTRVACSYDGVNLIGYVDGAVVASQPEMGVIDNNTTAVAYAQNDPSGDNFIGIVDEIEIWARLVPP